MKNESKYDDMLDIMDELHKYVPKVVSTASTTVNDTVHLTESEKLYPICLGGDQLSVAR